MSAEEWDISRSTPGARFDAPPSPAPPSATPAAKEDSVAAPQASAEVEAFVAQLLADREQPLVLFALEWCEFCWSLRKLFAQCGMPYRSVDLDSAAYQRDDRGGQIRAVLAARTGSRTIPQVFVGGEYIGGCTETLELAKDGRLQRLLKSHGVSCDESVSVVPQALLPAWLQPR
ncbi:glutaredoxin domain-containing protein [Lysobacter tyrosinilyticus]